MMAATKRFRGLTPAQERAFGLIAMGQDGGHHPKTLAALEAKGLIAGENQTLGGRLPVTIRRYYVPTSVHIEWCDHCALTPTRSEE